jgi:hypothetical protein
MRWGNVWPGSTVVVMASGPSLTETDVETVRQWRENGENRYVIVTNTTYQLAPWADVLFFHDFKWWKKYKGDVRAKFAGKLVTVASVNVKDVDWLRGWTSFGNSGAASIALATLAGADRVITLGMDCQYTGGARHWHGDHPSGLGNARSLAKWPAAFKRLAGHCKSHGTEVINASRQTALECFERQPLEDALCLN